MKNITYEIEDYNQIHIFDTLKEVKLKFGKKYIKNMLKIDAKTGKSYIWMKRREEHDSKFKWVELCKCGSKIAFASLVWENFNLCGTCQEIDYEKQRGDFVLHEHVSGYSSSNEDWDQYTRYDNERQARYYLKKHFTKHGNMDLVGGSLYKIVNNDVFEEVDKNIWELATWIVYNEETEDLEYDIIKKEDLLKLVI